jgi:hypothetical protein
VPDSPDAVDESVAELVAACTAQLLRSFPAPEGAVNRALAHAQAHQAVTVAARLRFPTAMDRALLALAGPPGPEDEPWADPTVVGWAAALLADPVLAGHATQAAGFSPAAYRRLTVPGPREQAAAALLRHPDLLDPTAQPHREELLVLLRGGPQGAAVG